MNERTRYIAIIAIVVGILGLGYLYYESTRGIPIAQAKSISENYLDSLKPSDLVVDEIMEFEHNYYVIYSEDETGIGAMEMLIDKTTGQIFPEYGPNMMWNLKYGHGGMMSSNGGMMGGYIPPGFESGLVSEEDVVEIAQRFLDLVYPGSEAEDPHPFYGYYTLHSTKNGHIFGMLSVNSLTGEVWYHNWHGEYIQSFETH